MQRGHQNSLENQSAFLALLMCAGLKVRASPSVRPSVQAVRLASPSTPAALLLQNNGACSCCCCGPRDRQSNVAPPAAHAFVVLSDALLLRRAARLSPVQI